MKAYVKNKLYFIVEDDAEVDSSYEVVDCILNIKHRPDLDTNIYTANNRKGELKYILVWPDRRVGFLQIYTITDSLEEICHELGIQYDRKMV